MAAIANLEVLGAASVALLGALLLSGASWGPGTHIQLTQALLGRFRRMRRVNAAQAIAMANPEPFLYGNIAADIINFKAYGGIKNHCHNWNIEERLESLAKSDAARAFILGYLCHLAADVIAHNHFVPFHVVFSFPPRVFGHAYWEAMADSHVSDVEWHAIDALKRNRALHAFDQMVHDAVERRALGIRSNRWIFNNILLISCRKEWRDLVRSVAKNATKHPLEEAFHRKARAVSLRNMLSVFHPRRLAVLKARDPTGLEALRGAQRLRRGLLIDLGHRARAREISRELARAAFGNVR